MTQLCPSSLRTPPGASTPRKGAPTLQLFPADGPAPAPAPGPTRRQRGAARLHSERRGLGESDTAGRVPPEKGAGEPRVLGKAWPALSRAERF